MRSRSPNTTSGIDTVAATALCGAACKIVSLSHFCSTHSATVRPAVPKLSSGLLLTLLQRYHTKDKSAQHTTMVPLEQVHLTSEIQNACERSWGSGCMLFQELQTVWHNRL